MQCSRMELFSNLAYFGNLIERGANMASRLFDKNLQNLLKGCVLLAGSFDPNGSSTIAASGNLPSRNAGWTVAWTSTGLYTITLSDKYLALISCWADLQLASGDDKFLQIGVVDVTSAKTIQIRCYDNSGGTISLADIAAATGNRINFGLILQNTAY